MGGVVGGVVERSAMGANGVLVAMTQAAQTLPVGIGCSYNTACLAARRYSELVVHAPLRAFGTPVILVLPTPCPCPLLEAALSTPTQLKT